MSRSADLTCRLATPDDLPRLRVVMRLAIEELQRGFLSEEQVAASRAIMGLDSQLVLDGTYYVVQSAGEIAGCGGWSRRATLYGGDHSAELREPRLLDPRLEPARIRAMYTHPSFVRRGVGKLILQTAERAAVREGFSEAELMATLAGQPLYTSCDYAEVERTSDVIDGVEVPLVRMRKALVR